LRAEVSEPSGKKFLRSGDQPTKGDKRLTQTLKAETVEEFFRTRIEFYRDFRVDGHLIVNLFSKTSGGLQTERERYYPVKTIVFRPSEKGHKLEFKGIKDAVGGSVGTPQEIRVPLAHFVITPFGADGFEIDVERAYDKNQEHYYVLAVRSQNRYYSAYQE
jgi:hypothetical protein